MIELMSQAQELARYLSEQRRNRKVRYARKRRGCVFFGRYMILNFPLADRDRRVFSH